MALVDDVKITIKAGNGGNGSSTFLAKTDSPKTTPDGGDGGRGGHIYFQASHNISDLSQFRFTKNIIGDNGTNGSRKNMTGKSGEDTVILVPPGTKVIDEDTTDMVEIIEEGVPVLLARGGQGGDGNFKFKANSSRERIPHPEGYPGEEKSLHLIQSLIADIGFIGLPNAGKSSLLTSLTNATPKIGNYPFTTLEPNLGTFGKLVLADIPGLIEGASQGTGLGVQFLKHIEKTKILFHCIDVSDLDPVKTYKTIREEFEKYNPELLEKDEIILLTKIDLVDADFIEEQKEKLKNFKRKIILISIYDEKSLEKLKALLKKYESDFYFPESKESSI